jgi:PadR family transcriptional regulator PadR
MKAFSGDMLRGHLELLVLATLERSEAHGFEVLQRLNREGRGAFAMKEGTLYPVLYRLENRRYVRARWESDAAPRKGPPRRLYSLTAAGTRELAKQRESWTSFVGVMDRLVEG